jgi:hypothetical protein
MRFHSLFLVFALFLAALVQSVFGAAIDIRSLTDSNSTVDYEIEECHSYGEGGAQVAKRGVMPGSV